VRRAARELRLLARDPLLLGLVVVIMAALLVFVLYPIVLVLRQSLVTPDGVGLDNYALLAERRLYRNALRNSVGVAALVGALSVVTGYVVAFTLARTDVPLKRVLHNLTTECQDVAIIYIEETLAAGLSAEIDRFKNSVRPAIILIPGREGSTGKGLTALHEAVKRAIGTDIL